MGEVLFGMAQSLSRVFVHLIFSTKGRRPFLGKDNREEVFRYLGGVASHHGCAARVVGGFSDHVHLLCELGRTISVADLVMELKRGSSRWIKERFEGQGDFAWQAGYGAFSVGQSQVADVERYIANQEEHHRVKSFQEEYLAFLKRYEVDYDERYLWE